MAELGASLLAASAPVSSVKRYLAEVTPQYGFTSKCYVLPTGIIAVNPERRSMTLVLAEPASYRFDQTLHLFALMERALRGGLEAREGVQRLRLGRPSLRAMTTRARNAICRRGRLRRPTRGPMAPAPAGFARVGSG